MRRFINLSICWVAALMTGTVIDLLAGNGIASDIAGLWVFVVMYVLLTGGTRPSSNDLLD